MQVNIEDDKLRLVWSSVWARLTPDVQKDLQTWVGEIKDDIRPCNEVDFGCGNYSELVHSIKLYNGDLSRLSDYAIAWVMTHELGHAYCHIKCGTPAPITPTADYDGGANCVASSWGFHGERQRFEKEKITLVNY